MATDKSEPRVGLIVRVGVISLVTLAAVRVALVSYFDQVDTAESSRKIRSAKPEALMELRTDEHARLMTVRMPIQSAMEAVAKNRMAASPEIVPSASRDLSPLQGWAQMPASVPPSMTLAAQAPSASAAPAADTTAPDAAAPARTPEKPADAPKKKP
jgi:hypothetical protein